MSRNIFTIDEIRRLTRSTFERNGIKKAILFGSYAKKIATEQSDIDIFVDSNGKLSGLNFFGFREDLQEDLKKNVDLIEKIELIEGSLLEDEIEEYGVVIYEGEA